MSTGGFLLRASNRQAAGYRLGIGLAGKSVSRMSLREAVTIV